MSDERRREVRQGLSSAAIIYDTDGSFVMRCVASDLSASGGRLKLSEDAQLPRYFLLELPPEGSAPRLCGKVWQLALTAGVRFVLKPVA